MEYEKRLDMESNSEAEGSPSTYKVIDNSIWVALDFPRVCVETVIAGKGSEECESMDPVVRSDVFSCLLGTARKRLEEAIMGSSCRKPCCARDTRGGKGVELLQGGEDGKGVELLQGGGDGKGLDATTMAELGFQEESYFGGVSSIWMEGGGGGGDKRMVPGSPHDGLFYVLPFLLLKDLLSVEKVCKSLKDVVVNDTLLWRHLKVDHSLSTKLTDDTLLRLASRSQGHLQSLMLVECVRISDETVETVVAMNPKISRILLPGCIRVSVDAVVRMVEMLQQGKAHGLPGVKQVKIRGLTGLTMENLKRLQTLLGVESSSKQPSSKPHYYLCGDVSTTVDERAIDVEACPRCNQPRAVFDCTRDKCREWKSAKRPECRGCIFCIPRCEDCGMCLEDTEYEETFCLRLLCPECCVRLPKCLECNRPGTESSSDYFIRMRDAIFVCPDCQGAYKGEAGAGLQFYVI